MGVAIARSTGRNVGGGSGVEIARVDWIEFMGEPVAGAVVDAVLLKAGFEWLPMPHWVGSL